MKGQTKVTLNGKEITLKFTLGVVEDLQDWAKKNNVKNPDSDMKGQRVMFALMELYATDDWMEGDILEKAEKECLKYKALGVDQITSMMEMIEEASDKMGKDKAKQ